MNGLKPSGPADRPSQMSDLAGRKKIALAPGHSLMDWIRLGRTSVDLSGVGPTKQTVTVEDLAKHNREEDIWMSLRGKVYNITPYVSYHPGGVDELMRAAGKDGTQLFDEIHNWVNMESMLEKCLVGYLETPVDKVKERKPSKPSLKVIEPRHSEAPMQDWFQKMGGLTVVIYTKKEDLLREFVTTEVSESEITIHILIDDYSYFVHFKPCHPVKKNVKVTVVKGKVEVSFDKVNKETHWSTLGKLLDQNDVFTKTKRLAPKYRRWTVTNNIQVNYNTFQLRLKAPEGYTMLSPIGFHIHIVLDISGMQIGRSYTLIPPSLLKPKSDPEQEEGHAINIMMKYYPDGILTPILTKCKPGDTLMVSNYDGKFDRRSFDKITHLIFFGAGSGLTSFMYVILYALNELPGATFPVHFVNCNRTQEDIIWNDQIEKLSAKHSRFSVTHVLSQESEEKTGWTGLTGRISYSIFEQFVPFPDKNCVPYVCICGQWAFNDSVYNFAKQHGLPEEQIKVFAS